MRLEMHARVGEQGRLFGSITSADIAEQLTAQLGEEIDRRKIDLDDPIRTVGEHEVVVRLVGRLTPKIIVAVSDPDAPVAAAESDDDAGDAMADETANSDATMTDDIDDIDETG
jgi:large subunit ribosomal protein L9